jgi:hypothetical protein
MRLGGKRILSLVAISAIALHAILWGVAPLAGPTLDPFSVICHSDSASPAEQPPTDSAPTHLCDHCTLCNAANASATLDFIFEDQLVPARLLQVLQPASMALRGHLTTAPNLARGPPLFV